jgi:hypothetical protein
VEIQYGRKSQDLLEKKGVFVQTGCKSSINKSNYYIEYPYIETK